MDVDKSPSQGEGDRHDGGGGLIRVGWIAGRQADGPLARAYQPLVIGLMDELVDVVLFHPRGGCGKPGAALSGESAFSLPLLPVFRGAMLRRMADEVRGAKIELLHALDESVLRLTRKVAKAAGVRFVASVHGVGDGRRMRKPPRRTAAVLAASTPIRQVIAARGLIDADRLVVVRPGVHCVRKPTCFDESARSIAIVAGGDQRCPGAFEAILRTFAELKERKHDCVFFVICSGKMEKGIRRAAARGVLADSLTFVDPRLRAQFTGIIKAADVYVSAGPPEHLDLHVLLAMSAGSAVLCPDDPSADFLIDGRTVLLYQAGRSEELTAKLVSLLDDPRAGRSLAQGALSHVSAHHSPARIVVETAAIYRRALAT